MKEVVGLWLAVFCLCGSVSAETPTELSKVYFEILKKGEYQKVGGLFSEKALKSFREVMSFGEELPPEVADRFYSSFFGENASRDAVGKMTDQEFFSSFLSSMIKQASEAGEISFEKVEVLGEVPEGDGMMHVLTRNHVSIGEMKMEKMEVVSFEETEGGWKLMLSGQIRGMAAQLKKAFEN